MPFHRRQILIFALAAGLAPLPVHAESGPEALVRALYQAHLPSIPGTAKPLQVDEKSWPRFFTQSLINLWRKANLRTPKGDVGPVDFDPFTASQDPEVKNLRFSLEAGGELAKSATVLARFDQYGQETRVAYTLLRVGESWRVDDVVPLVEGKPWSLRRALSGRPQKS